MTSTAHKRGRGTGLKAKDLNPDTAAAIAFLQRFHSNGPWHLVAISEGKVRGQTFTGIAEMRVWLDARQGKANLYFHVNRLRHKPKSGKATKADIAAGAYLHVDVDDPSAAALDRIRASDPPPSVITYSGGGYQAFWRLDRHTENLQMVESCNTALATRLGGDNCHNIDRIMRLPGTINVLSKQKIARGRKPALAYIVEENWDRVIDGFAVQETKHTSTAVVSHDVRPVGIDALGADIDKFLLALIQTGDDPSAPRGTDKARFGSRSEALWRAINELLRLGFDDETIAGLILNPELGISESVLDKPSPTKYASRQVAKAREGLSIFPDVTPVGRPRATLPNTKLALIKLGIECRFDEFKLRYEINGHQIEQFVGEVSDPALLRLRELIYENYKFDPNTETVLTAVQTLANHARFHPVRDYLDGLIWDGKNRIDDWLTVYAGAEKTDFTRAIGSLFFTAAVRRVRSPGCKFDELIVLEGEQGTNKSQALKLLAIESDWFSDDLPLGLSTRETIEALSGRWIVEVAELNGMRKADVEKIKALLSRDTDRARTAYAKTVTDARRQCVVIGTTNAEQYLRDLTGNRRFWPVRIERFDLVSLTKDRDQLWAEAALREANGESIRLPEELWAVAAVAQNERIQENPFVSVLDRVFREHAKRGEGRQMEGKVLVQDVWTAVGIPPERRSQFHLEMLGHAMQELGWTRKRLRVGENGRAYMYVRGDEPYCRINVYAGDRGDPGSASYESDEEKPEY